MVAPAFPGVADAKKRKKKKTNKGKAGRVERLDAMARKAYGEGNFEEAIAGFKAAYKVGKGPKFLFNIARAYEKWGKLEKAVKYLNKYIPKAPSDTDRVDAEAMVDLLQARMSIARGELVVAVDPVDAAVRITGGSVELGQSGPMSEELEAGEYVVTVSKEGFETAVRKVTVEADEKAELRIGLEPSPEPAPLPAPPPVAAVAESVEESPPAEPAAEAGQAPKPDSGGALTTGAYVAYGVGALLLAGAGLYGVRAAGAESDLDDLSKERRVEGSKLTAARDADEPTT